MDESKVVHELPGTTVLVEAGIRSPIEDDRVRPTQRVNNVVVSRLDSSKQQTSGILQPKLPGDVPLKQSFAEGADRSVSVTPKTLLPVSSSTQVSRSGLGKSPVTRTPPVTPPEQLAERCTFTQTYDWLIFALHGQYVRPLRSSDWVPGEACQHVHDGFELPPGAGTTADACMLTGKNHVYIEKREFVIVQDSKGEVYIDEVERGAWVQMRSVEGAEEEPMLWFEPEPRLEKPYRLYADSKTCVKQQREFQQGSRTAAHPHVQSWQYRPTCSRRNTNGSKSSSLHRRTYNTRLCMHVSHFDKASQLIRHPMPRIFVAAATGGTVAVEVSPADTVRTLKEQLELTCGVAAAEQRLTCGLQVLEDEETLEALGIEESCTLYQSLSLLGAGKKRKKKTYTKPKKQKHKKKKVKLAVLKFYKVDANDKVTRLRKECPRETCGAGVFMAAHENRTYCGRCGLTYILNPEEKTEA
ncbi:UNVERIFIED_CONTAM: hypothetical protein H355_005328 [Colinus virginianus]|nr:hypothetical protein H355_005328 [Colinus virginianus]